MLPLLLLVLVTTPSATAAPPAQPLERAHAHNDYEHPRPLHDALAAGFTSVEADIWLVGGVLVAHDPQDLRPGRSLEALYLDPLRERVRAQGGTVHRGHRGAFQLLVDVKTDPVATYVALDRVLQRYAPMLWSYDAAGTHQRAVQVVVSGNRAQPYMAQQPVRYAAVDGRFGDLGTTGASLTPLISDNYGTQFAWRGQGAMPAAERRRLRSAVAQAHARGQRLRLWATPDTPGRARERVWAELVAAGVDHLNTDDLDGLRAWLLEHDPQERGRKAG